MNKTAITAGTIGALLLGAAACASPDAPAHKTIPTQGAVTATAAAPTKKPATAVVIKSGKRTKVEYLGEVFRIQYTIRNTTPAVSDFLVTFEYRDKTGTRIGEGIDSVEALASGQTAKLKYDDYGTSGFKLADVKSVRVTQVRSWPSA